MKVICEKYNVCTGVYCCHKKPRDWDGFSFLLKNYCNHIEENIDFLSIKDIRKKKLEKINESNL